MSVDKNNTMTDEEFEEFKQKLKEVRLQVFGKESSLSKQQIDIFNNFEQRIDFAEGLKKLVKDSGIKQKELASKIMVEERIVSEWINAGALPNLDNLFAITKFFENKGFKPLQVLFPSMLESEIQELRQTYDNEIENIKATESVKKYQELESDLDCIQEQFNSLKLKYNRLIDRIKQLPKRGDCRETLFEYILCLEKEDKNGSDKLIDEIEEILNTDY